MRTRTRSNRALLNYLLLNILVSAATTLLVLFAWDFIRQRDLPRPIDGLAQTPAAGQVLANAGTTVLPGGVNATPAPADTTALPPLDVPVIEILRVAGVGDINQEVLTLRRVGDGDLHMAGWRLYDEGGNTFTFPQSPELVLFKDGGVQVFSKGGSDTATEIYWNLSTPVWEPTELVTLADSQGNVRATYRVP